MVEWLVDKVLKVIGWLITIELSVSAKLISFSHTRTIAAMQHAIWSHWMRYMFTQGTMNEDGTFTLPEEKVLRWKRQMATPYQELTLTERASDNRQANKMIEALPDVAKLFREKMGEVQHLVWSHWMEYYFTAGILNKDGTHTIPADKVKRWQRQMNTTYNDLPLREQALESYHVDKTLAVLEQK
jgi:hypothetical protein